MKLVDLPDELASMDDIVVELVPSRHRCQLRSGELRKLIGWLLDCATGSLPLMLTG